MTTNQLNLLRLFLTSAFDEEETCSCVGHLKTLTLSICETHSPLKFWNGVMYCVSKTIPGPTQNVTTRFLWQWNEQEKTCIFQSKLRPHQDWEPNPNFHRSLTLNLIRSPKQNRAKKCKLTEEGIKHAE